MAERRVSDLKSYVRGKDDAHREKKITMQKDTEVLIVGAGPVGLTLANDLAARNVPF